MDRHLHHQHTSLYKILEIPCTASNAVIRKAFHKIAQRISPDRYLNHPEWKTINERFAYLIFAHDILKKPDTRAVYDERGFKGLRHMGISIPAGFSNYQLNHVNSSLTFSPLKFKSIYHNSSGIQSSEEPIQNEKSRECHHHNSNKGFEEDWKRTFRFAAYKQVVKIAWRKELMNELRR